MDAQLVTVISCDKLNGASASFAAGVLRFDFRSAGSETELGGRWTNKGRGIFSANEGNR